MKTHEPKTPQQILATPRFAAIRAAIDGADTAPEVPPDDGYRADLMAVASEGRRASMNLPLRHWHADTSKAVDSEWNKTRKRVEARCGQGFLIALVGTRGTGKTQIGAELLRLHGGWFCTAMDFFLELKASFRRDSAVAEAEVLQRYQSFPILVIDEMQERSESPWEDRLLVHMLNKRYNSMKDTLVISNQKPQDFVSAVGQSLASRMLETGGIIECNWESFRK